MIFRKRVTLEHKGMLPFKITPAYVEISADDPQNEYNSHVHPQCEIYVNLGGDVSFMVENRLYPIIPGSIVITRPYEYHHCIYNGKSIHKHIWILFSSDGNEELFDMFFNRQAGENNLFVLTPEKQNEFLGICMKMIEEKCSEIEKYYCFFKLMHILESADSFAPPEDIYPKDVVDALNYIDKNFSEPIAVSDIAEAAHVSVNTLERHFRDVLKMTPSIYLKKKRLAHAAERLYKGDTVMQACESSGFGDYSNFISLFKRTYGLTPLKYKENIAKRNK